MIAHATLIARSIDGEWRGVLVRGASGAGKSDLALRAGDAGWRLVADDRVVLWASAGRLWGRAPDALLGLIEARGVGVAAIVPLRLARIDLVADDAAADVPPERLPDPQVVELQSVAVPHLRLRLLDASAPGKLDLALRRGGAAL